MRSVMILFCIFDSEIFSFVLTMTCSQVRKIVFTQSLDLHDHCLVFRFVFSNLYFHFADFLSLSNV